MYVTAVQVAICIADAQQKWCGTFEDGCHISEFKAMRRQIINHSQGISINSASVTFRDHVAIIKDDAFLELSMLASHSRPRAPQAIRQGADNVLNNMHSQLVCRSLLQPLDNQGTEIYHSLL